MPGEPVSTTRFRAWLLCLSCGHVWTVSRLSLAFRAWTRLGHGPVRTVRSTEDAATLALADAAQHVQEREPDPALQSWLAELEPGATAGQRWNTVDAWLDTDPLPLAATVRDGALEEEWGLARRPEPAKSAPRTLLERLDALYQGMLQLERFVEKSAQMEEAIVAARDAAAPPAALPRPRPRLVPRPAETPRAPAAA